MAVLLRQIFDRLMGRSGRLPKACLVISDLAGAWGEGSLRIQQAIDNANREVGRGAHHTGAPRQRGALRDPAHAPAGARGRRGGKASDWQAYAEAFRTAVQQGVMPESYQRWAREISQSYPFHPGLHELFARFRENPGFQQTREILRLSRRMIADLWETSQAERTLLVHPHALNFVDQDVAATLERINPSLNNARARDVANVQHAAAAEALSPSGEAAATASRWQALD
jgi:hypothetical protein